MNRPCPRCGQNLIVHARGPATVTCPVCLASIRTGSKPLPSPPLSPPLPIRAIPIADADTTSPEPLHYQAISDDVEAELERDFRWSLYGIVTFALASIVALFVMVPQMDITMPALVWFSGVAIMTSLAAAWLMARHRRARAEAGMTGVTTRRTTGERIGGLVALSIAGVFATGAMVLISFVVVFILIVATCFGGGFKL
jgi:hypothetical protein